MTQGTSSLPVESLDKEPEMEDNVETTTTTKEPPPPTNEIKSITDEEHRRWVCLINAVVHSGFERQQILVKAREAQRTLDRERRIAEICEKRAQREEDRADAEAREDARFDFLQGLEEWKYERDCKKRRNRLSRGQVDSKVFRIVDEVRRGEGLLQRKGEGLDAWRGRMGALHDKVYAVWGQNRERILGREPRYVEGLPARMIVGPPRFFAHVGLERTGVEACLQCVVKGLQCPLVVIRWIKPDPEEMPCVRCVRNGERCLIYVREKPREWGFAPGVGPETGPEETEGKEEAPTKKKTPLRKKKVAENAEEKLLIDELQYQSMGFRMEIIGGRMQRVHVKGFALPKKDDDDELREKLLKKYRVLDGDEEEE